jgi:error-prone DNA polymerase
LIKVDVLALGMLTAIRKTFDSLNRHHGTALAVKDIPPEDGETYRMIQRADTIGVFQIESRAQMSMLPRLKPKCFYDLVIEVAIVRPGPIQGGMVHPYLKRRNGQEKVVYPSAAVEKVLERTLGVSIFQEQVMQLAVIAAGFTPGEADRLRRAMAAWKRKGGIEPFREKLISGMLARGYTDAYARIACGEFCITCVCVVLLEMSSSGGVYLRSFEQSAARFLFTFATGAGCETARRNCASGGCDGE